MESWGSAPLSGEGRGEGGGGEAVEPLPSFNRRGFILGAPFSRRYDAPALQDQCTPTVLFKITARWA